MRTLKALLAIVTGTIVAMATADAKAEWQTVYQTDFSTDPGWTTDQPNNFYWDSTNQQYFLSMTNQKQAYTPSRYLIQTRHMVVARSTWNGIKR